MGETSKVPKILVVEGWRGKGRGVLVSGWSEMADGPVETGFVAGIPVGDGLRDGNGSLVGGLYEVDYRRGQADFAAGRSPPAVTTPSYDLGRASASEEAALAREVIAAVEARAEAGHRAVREMLGPEARIEFDAGMADIRSGIAGARMEWGSLSPVQRAVASGVLPGGATLVRLPGSGTYGGKGVSAARASTVAALVARGILEWSGPPRRPSRVGRTGQESRPHATGRRGRMRSRLSEAMGDRKMRASREKRR